MGFAAGQSHVPTTLCREKQISWDEQDAWDKSKYVPCIPFIPVKNTFLRCDAKPPANTRNQATGSRDGGRRGCHHSMFDIKVV